MAIKIQDILYAPVVTDKAYKLSKKLNKVIFRVSSRANAPLIKEAVETIFNVKVRDVAIINCKGKTRRVGKAKKLVTRPGVKKAIISLAKGYSLDLFNQANAEIISNEHTANINKQDEKL